jgi:hypothetical protein
MNRIDFVEYLIGCGIDINSAKDGGLTPLHLAAFTGSLDAAKRLVEMGASLDLESRDGGTPLHYAVAARNHEMADFLRAHGAKDTARAFPKFRGKYLGQKTPGTEPEPFVPELFRDIYRSYSTPVFSPDGKEMFLNVYLLPGIDYNRIWWMKEEKGRWTAPVLAQFSDFPSWQAALSHDGKKIFFASRRPKQGDHSDFCDLWFAEKRQDGTWSEAKPLGSPPNRDTFN